MEFSTLFDIPMLPTLAVLFYVSCIAVSFLFIFFVIMSLDSIVDLYIKLLNFFSESVTVKLRFVYHLTLD